LHEGVPGREADAGRQALPDLRGHLADPAARDRPRHPFAPRVARNRDAWPLETASTIRALRVDATVSSYQVRRRRQARVRRLRRLAVVGVIVLVGALVFGFAYQGSSARIAAGVRVDGVDVGGLTSAEAQKLLRKRFATVAKQPLVVHAGGRTFAVTAGRLGVLPDWKRALAEARGRTSGVAVVRGFRRLYVRVFGVDVSARSATYRPALEQLLDKISKAVDVPRRDASLVLRGLHPVVLPSRVGSVLDRKRAAAQIVSRLASLDRTPLQLPP